MQEADNDFHLAFDGLQNLKPDNDDDNDRRLGHGRGRRGGKRGRGRGRNQKEDEEKEAPQSSSLFDYIGDDSSIKTMTVQVGRTMTNQEFRNSNQAREEYRATDRDHRDSDYRDRERTERDHRDRERLRKSDAPVVRFLNSMNGC